MKRWYLSLVFVFIFSSRLYAFDILGLQPVAPNGSFSAFSAESLPQTGVAFEIGVDSSHEPTFTRIMFKGAYGLTNSIELLVTAPLVYNFMDSVNGVEDIAFGIKHRFYDEGKYGPSLAYVLTASVPSGKDEISTQGRVGIGLILSKRIGPFQGHFNIFYEKPGTSKLNDELSFLGGLEFSASHNFVLLGEILARKSHYEDEYNQLETRFGYRIHPTEFMYTTLGIGFDFKNRSPEYRFLFSVAFVSPQKKEKIKTIYEEE